MLTVLVRKYTGRMTSDKEREEQAKRRLRAALDGVELLPEITSDDRPEPKRDDSHDAELKRNVPPHHG